MARIALRDLPVGTTFELPGGCRHRRGPDTRFEPNYLRQQCRYMVVSRRSTGGVRFRWEYLDCQYILCPPVGKRCHYHSSDWLPGHLEIELDPLALELEATFGAQNRIGTVKFWFQRVSARLRSSFAERLRY